MAGWQDPVPYGLWVKDMKGYLVVCFCVSLLAACQRKPAEVSEREALENRVMAVHDEAMGGMGRIFILRRNLGLVRDSLINLQADTASLQPLQQHLRALEQADAAMMNWMHQYKSPAKEQQADAARQYLQLQLQKMKQVKKQMDSSLTAAQRYYSTHEQKK